MIKCIATLKLTIEVKDVEELKEFHNEFYMKSIELAGDKYISKYLIDDENMIVKTLPTN